MILGKSYDEIMDKIIVTEEMRKEILQNVETEYKKGIRKKRVLSYGKGIATIAACLVLIITGAIAFPNLMHKGAEQPKIDDKMHGDKDDDIWEEGVGISSETVECETIEELSKMVGFSIKELSDLPFQLEEEEYTCYSEKLAEIRYIGGKQSVDYRISKEKGDNSGDYTEYEETEKTTIEKCSVTIKGDGRKYRLAFWQKGEYSYSLLFEKGVSRKDLLKVVKGAM